MTRNDSEFPKKIVTYLDATTAALRPGVAFRLQRARQEALARLSEGRHATGLQLANANGGSASGPMGGAHRFGASARLWLGIALIVATLFGYQQWRAYQELNEVEETDAALLSSDLPIDAYLDRGFQNWLSTVNDD